MAIDECPSKSATALICTPASSQTTGAECRRVWTPTPSTPGSTSAERQPSHDRFSPDRPRSCSGSHTTPIGHAMFYPEPPTSNAWRPYRLGYDAAAAPCPKLGSRPIRRRKPLLGWQKLGTGRAASRRGWIAEEEAIGTQVGNYLCRHSGADGHRRSRFTQQQQQLNVDIFVDRHIRGDRGCTARRDQRSTSSGWDRTGSPRRQIRVRCNVRRPVKNGWRPKQSGRNSHCAR